MPTCRMQHRPGICIEEKRCRIGW
ncbi:hypothetical protein GQ607_016598 [Colletotrichum asianum]|uniref:Uncharacterized protein n=1 Tax=Colletotrichum asianum TaxID=702518 RepID=A0A8H3W0S3_9PEZI|nr:hypothetical protein GQ607_016598 [Colletotrichum asianum]